MFPYCIKNKLQAPIICHAMCQVPCGIQKQMLILPSRQREKKFKSPEMGISYKTHQKSYDTPKGEKKEKRKLFQKLDLQKRNVINTLYSHLMPECVFQSMDLVAQLGT